MPITDVANKLNAIELIKTRMREEINTAGVTLTASEEFSVYPSKIAEIAYGGVTPETPPIYGFSTIKESDLTSLNIGSNNIVYTFTSQNGNTYFSCNIDGFGLYQIDATDGTYDKIYDTTGTYVKSFTEADDGLIYCILNATGVLKVVEDTSVTVTKPSEVANLTFSEIKSYSSGATRKTFFRTSSNSLYYEGVGSVGTIKSTGLQATSILCIETNEALYIDTLSGLSVLKVSDATFTSYTNLNYSSLIYDGVDRTYFVYITTGTYDANYGAGPTIYNISTSNGTDGNPLTFQTFTTTSYGSTGSNGFTAVILSNNLLLKSSHINPSDAKRWNWYYWYYNGTTLTNQSSVIRPYTTDYSTLTYRGVTSDSFDVINVDGNVFKLSTAGSVTRLTSIAEPYGTEGYFIYVEGDDVIYYPLNCDTVKMYKTHVGTILNSTLTKYWNTSTGNFSNTNLTWAGAIKTDVANAQINLDNEFCGSGAGGYLHIFNETTKVFDIQNDILASPIPYNGIFNNYSTDKYFLSIDVNKLGKLYKKTLANTWLLITLTGTSDNKFNCTKLTNYKLYDYDTKTYLTLYSSDFNSITSADFVTRNYEIISDVLHKISGYGGKQLDNKLTLNYNLYCIGYKSYTTIGDYLTSTLNKNNNYFNLLSTDKKYILSGGGN